jgi:DNA-binding transcriptional regulator LsrR (DeoR family)
MERRGPAELVLAAAVARRHYIEGQSKIEIADELGLSRFKVARLIEFARDSGIVRIEIVADGELDLDRSARLQERYGLRHAVVVDGSRVEPTALSAHLGAAAARLLSEILTDDDVLGLPWSRSVDTMTRALGDLPSIDVVQLSGAMEVEGHDSSAVDIVRRAARATGGGSSIFYAPLLLDDASGAATLRREPQVARVLGQASRVTKAVMGVGAWGPGMSTVFDAVSPTDREDIRALGIIGEVAGVFFDAKGRLVEPPLSQRIVTISADALRGIDEVIAIVSGEAKGEAVRAALTGGLVNAVVADAALSDELLRPD